MTVFTQGICGFHLDNHPLTHHDKIQISSCSSIFSLSALLHKCAVAWHFSYACSLLLRALFLPQPFGVGVGVASSQSGIPISILPSDLLPSSW